MGKRIIWSDQASDDLIDILEYWNNRTGSKSYSLKLFNNRLKIFLKSLPGFQLWDSILIIEKSSISSKIII